LNHETLIRLGAFAATFFAIALGEALVPRRPRMHTRAARWPANIDVSILDSIAVRIMLPLEAVGFAGFCAEHRWGLMNLVAMPRSLAAIASVVVLDLVIYLQHVMFHAIPALWRVHRMHHSDLEFDVSTGIRFHPIEIAISLGIKLTAIAALGTPAVGVLAFEVLLNATSLFNHANLGVPPAADAMIRRLIVTPDMHRVHHSIVVRETNSNFGFNLTWWDRLLGTYRAQPAAGHLAMTIGIEDFRDPRELKLSPMLVQPWRGTPGNYPINS
jgi:sterol desaturase/sphingolipid hydroxylase (fatty acid hydroxylase superfamily)